MLTITLSREPRKDRTSTWHRSRPIRTLVSAMAFITLAAALLSACMPSEASNVGVYEFDRPLRIPSLLEPEIDADGRKVFDLTFTAGETELLPGKTSKTWGLNGTYLSPTVRASRGDEVVLNVHNQVDEPTTLHWHGMHLPARMDGGPHQMIDPGETWSPNWTIDQPAASLWFHPHPHGATADHVYRGAAGMFIIDDPELDDLTIPKQYGIDDIPLIVQDKQFHPDGSLDFSDKAMSNLGILGNEILVNGTHSPVFEARTSLVRFRILNASNARVYNFTFDDERRFATIASDTGLLETPVPMTELLLSPGERAEIVVEIEPDDDVMLRSVEPEMNLDFWNERADGGRDSFDILRISGAESLAESKPLPDRLVTVERLDPADAVVTRTFSLDGTSRVNDQEMDMRRIDEVVEVDTTEIWEIRNGSGATHNFHIHLIHFQILDIDGQAPPRHLQGWKDTVFIPRGRTVRVIAEFKDYADPEVPYMYHCHMLEHEDNGMMGQFVVVEPGISVPKYLDIDDVEHASH
jgi:FtsP/CotA-like multicopper oxidase with cupredoxin domain